MLELIKLILLLPYEIFKGIWESAKEEPAGCVILILVFLGIALTYERPPTEQELNKKVFVYWEKGLEYAKKRKFKSASEQLIEANKILPDNIMISARLSHYLYMSGSLQEAEAYAKKALREAERPRDKYYRASLYSTLGDISMSEELFSAAIRNFKTAIETDPGRGEHYLVLALAYKTQEDYEKSLHWAEESLKREMKEKNQKKAEELIEACRQKLPDKTDEGMGEAEELWQKGNGYYDKEQYELAAEEFKKLHVLLPNDLNVLNALSASLVNTSIDEAKLYSQKALVEAKKQENNEVLVQLYDRMALIHWKEENYADALEPLQLCVKLKPENPLFYLSLAYNYKFLGEYEEAILWADRGLERTADENQRMQFERLKNLCLEELSRDESSDEAEENNDNEMNDSEKADEAGEGEE